MRIAIVVLALAGCGGPILQNAPKPDPAVVAGAAAVLAGAATLADPAAAAAKQEENKPTTEKRPITVRRVVPSDVFDRLDEQNDKPKPAPKATKSAPEPDDETVNVIDEP